MGRCLAAIWENYQRADGSIRVPNALVPYMDGDEMCLAAGSLTAPPSGRGQARSTWRDGRAVEGSCLENSQVMSLGGSNPSPSATCDRVDRSDRAPLQFVPGEVA